jgi:hypothetical protein
MATQINLAYEILKKHSEEVLYTINKLKDTYPGFKEFDGIPKTMMGIVDNNIRIGDFKKDESNTELLLEHLTYLNSPKATELKYNSEKKQLVPINGADITQIPVVKDVNQQLFEYTKLETNYSKVINELESVYKLLEEEKQLKQQTKNELDKTKKNLDNLLNENPISISVDSDYKISIEYNGKNSNIKKAIEIINDEIKEVYKTINNTVIEKESAMILYQETTQKLEELIESNQNLKNVGNEFLTINGITYIRNDVLHRKQQIMEQQGTSLDSIDEETKKHIDEAIRKSNPTYIFDYLTDLKEAAKRGIHEAIIKEKRISQEKQSKIEELETIVQVQNELIKENNREKRKYQLKIDELNNVEAELREAKRYNEELENKVIISQQAKTQSRENAAAFELSAKQNEEMYKASEKEKNNLLLMYGRSKNSIKRLVSKREELRKRFVIMLEENQLQETQIQRMAGPYEKATKIAGELELMKSHLMGLENQYQQALGELDKSKLMIEERTSEVETYRNQYKKQIHLTQLTEIEAKKAKEEALKFQRQNRIRDAQLKVLVSSIDNNNLELSGIVNDDEIIELTAIEK